MEFLSQLWMAILLSSVFVFLASSIIHMVLPIHRGDFRKMPGEEQILEAMRGAGLQAGCYMFPGCESMKEMGTPEMMAKYKQGPVGTMTVKPAGPPAMGKSLIQWFLFTLVVGIFAAYVGWHTMEPGASFRLVFRVIGALSFLPYGMSYVSDTIWKGQSWSITGKFLFDGLVYALVTGLTFGWLWPGA